MGGANRHVPQRQRRVPPLAEEVTNQRARLFCLGGRIKSPGGTALERSGRGTGGERGTAPGMAGWAVPGLRGLAEHRGVCTA